jgi:hypothetical protein
MVLSAMSMIQKSLSNTVLLAALTLSLTACGVSTKELRLDGQALAPPKDVVRLVIHTHQQFPGQPFDYHSWADLVSVDGAPVPKSGVAFVQLSPGSHLLQYNCGVRNSINSDWQTGDKEEKRFSLTAAGTTYWPTVSSQFNGIQLPRTCAVSNLQDVNPIMQAL